MNAYDEETNSTLVRFAVNARKKRILSLLLARGADPSKPDRFFTTPLMKAVLLEDEEMVKMILPKEIHLNAINWFGYSALAYAARKGNERLVALLLEQGANVCFSDEEQKKNVVVQAVKSGSVPILYRILNARKPDLATGYGFGVMINLGLIKAACLGRIKMVDFLLEIPRQFKFEPFEMRPNPNCDVMIGNTTALMSAISNGHTEIAQKLLDYSSQTYYTQLLSYRVPRGMALAIAVGKALEANKSSDPQNSAREKEYLDIVDLLLAEGANPLVDGPSHPSAIYIAAQAGNQPDLLNRLLEYAQETDANAPQKALLNAAALGSYSAVTSLLIYGVSPNIQDIKGDTPLMKAVLIADDRKITDEFLQLEADPTITNNKGDTALHKVLKNPNSVAKEKIFISLIAALKCHNRLSYINAQNNDGDTPLHCACRHPADLQIVDILLDLGADHDLRNKKGETPLLCAVELNNKDAVESLLLAKADPNAKNNSGCGPLVKAVGQANKEIMTLLIQNGARIDEFKDAMLREASKKGHIAIMEALIARGAQLDSGSSSYGNTPLHKAAHKQQLGAVKLLLNAGAKTDTINRKGQTPYDIAVARSDHEITKLLLKHG